MLMPPENYLAIKSKNLGVIFSDKDLQGIIKNVHAILTN